LSYLFYRRKLTPLLNPPEPRPDLTVELWRPSLAQPLPPDLPVFPFGIWSLFHYFRVFATRDYAVLLIRQRGRLVNRACLFPAHFKFPFMRRGDLQVAGVWTEPSCRGEGLGLLAVHELLLRCAQADRVLWYMVREKNLPSIRLAEKAQFTFWGYGERKPWLGLEGLGRFHVTGGGASIALGAGQLADPCGETQGQE